MRVWACLSFRRLTVLAAIGAATLLACCHSSWSGPAREAAFGGALVGNTAAGIAKPNALYNSRPLTVECWAKLKSKAGFNILVANELKSSATHWELYLFAASGKFSLYQPGCAPNTVQGTDVCDGKWHYLAAVMETTRARLYVDAKKVADVQLKPPSKLGQAGGLRLGDLVEGTIGCDGMVDEVRISNVAREIRAVPAGPFEVDENTVGLWHFDESEGEFLDSSRTANHAERRAISRIERADPTELTSEEAGERRKGGGPPGGKPIPLPPPEVDLKATRQAFERALHELRLSSLRGAEQTRDGVLLDWEEQYFRLGLRVAGKEVPPNGAAEQAFDRHAVCYPSDGDPLGVVLRRTEALLDALQDRSDRSDQSDRSEVAQDFAKLRAHCAAISPTDTSTRKALYLAACALRRQLAFTNPLVNFDRLLFIARGVRLGSRVTGSTSTHDVWGQHFATQYYGFNALPGGGLFVVENWRDEPRVTNLLADSVVESGRLKGRKLEPGGFLSPDLSWDGKTIAFAYTENREHKWVWSKETTFNLFRVNVDGTDLVQLTDSEFDDFDPCWLPNGRIAFISERRGGYIRCFAVLHVPNHVLHSMNADGTDLLPLGIVPVEDDGSAHFEAPAGKELIFQVLDERYMAVQSMRSVAYLHRGEHLTCQGCHESKHTAPVVARTPKAMQRPPSRLEPEVGPVEPITYYRLVKPVFERTCIPCHLRTRKGPADMSYAALEPYAFYFAGGMSGTTIKPIHGGSRSIPGRFGARHSRMGKALLNDTHRGKIPEEDYRRVVLWLDCNSLRLGAFHDEEKQMKGEVVWPVLDVDPVDMVEATGVRAQ